MHGGDAFAHHSNIGVSTFLEADKAAGQEGGILEIWRGTQKPGTGEPESTKATE